ncbi:UNVERIFIED_ORG: hypothetical protein L601_000400001840 [Gordonia westfalica J30]
MIRATWPSIDDKDLYSRATIHRTDASTELSALREPVLTRYETYSNEEGLCAPKTWPHSDNELLKENWHCLSAESFRDVRPEIFRTTGKLCFLCGRKAGEIDHYLPRTKFPEYSIFAPNLLPACRYCNNKKRARYHQNGERLYFHPHYMQLPRTRFLFVELTFGSTVTVTYDVDRTSNGEIFEVLRRHFDDLQLADRYRDDAIDYLIEQLTAYDCYLEASGETGLRSILQTEANSVAGARGKNHWRAALLQALADSNEFCSGGFRVLGTPPLSLDV